MEMESAQSLEVAHDFPPFLRIYNDGRVERLLGTATVGASADAATGVRPKDVTVSPESGVSVRLYLPSSAASAAPGPSTKLPVLVYFHGGGFCIETAASPLYHNYLNALAAEAGAFIVSVDYRRSPEHPVPAAYDDSWTAIRWLGSHSGGSGPEAWINAHADLSRVFLAGDSAGANIAHRMGLRAGEDRRNSNRTIGFDLQGVVLVHPYFWGNDPIHGEPTEPEKRAQMAGIWRLACMNSRGCDDPMVNPAKDPSVSKMGCETVVVFVAEKDVLRERGWQYKGVMEKSGWEGTVEVIEEEGEDHVFHLFCPNTEKAAAMMKRLAAFINFQKKN